MLRHIEEVREQLVNSHLLPIKSLILLHYIYSTLPTVILTFKYEAQTALFKDPVLTAP